MFKLKSMIRVMLFLLVSGLFIGGIVYSGTHVRIPILGWRVSLFFVCAIAATIIGVIAGALGIDLGESRASVSIGDDGDWDD